MWSSTTSVSPTAACASSWIPSMPTASLPADMPPATRTAAIEPIGRPLVDSRPPNLSTHKRAMSMPKEIEIKLELSPAILPRLKKIPLLRAPKGATRRSAEVSVYFDTDEHKLRKKGLMLRVRRIGNRYIQTIKATGKAGLFERDEWESGIASAQPDLDLARGTALEALVGPKLRRRLKPMFETRVARTVYPLSSSKGEIESPSTAARSQPEIARRRC